MAIDLKKLRNEIEGNASARGAPTTAVPSAVKPPTMHTGSPRVSSRTGGSGKWWAIGLGLVALIAWLGHADKPLPARTAPTYEPPAPTPAPAYQMAAPAPTDQMPAPTPQAAQSGDLTTSQASAPSDPSENNMPSDSSDEESVPPVGNGLTLNRSQIRYCLSEKIRLEAWRGEVKKDMQASVDAFNSAVEYYSVRCSNAPYETAEFESVRSEVEANRAALIRQGLSQADAMGISVPTEQNTQAIRASFDCVKARSDAEHLICNDAQLAAADVDLANLYASAMAAVKDQDALKQKAREQWIYREHTCHDRDCLVQWYQRQRQWLTTISNGQGLTNGPS